MSSPQTLVRPRESQNGHAQLKPREVNPAEMQRAALVALASKEQREKFADVLKSLESDLQAMGHEIDREKVKDHFRRLYNAWAATLQTMGENLYKGILDQEIDGIIVKNHPRVRIECDREMINILADRQEISRQGQFKKIVHKLYKDGFIILEDLIRSLHKAGFDGEETANLLRQNYWQH